MRTYYRRTIWPVTALVVITTAGAALVTAAAGARERPFTPISARDHISALRGAPLSALPPDVARLPADLRPRTAWPMGAAGYIWERSGGDVCVLMTNRTGGCFDKFEGPVALFLTGTKGSAGYVGPQKVSGVAPDAVKSIRLVTDDGASVTADLDDNGFVVEINAGAAIVGYHVIFKHGETLFVDDELYPAPLSH